MTGNESDKNSHLHDLLIGNLVSKFENLASIICCVLYFSRDVCPSSREENIRWFSDMESFGTKEFLRNRCLKTTGNKNELTALAFGAEQLFKLTAEEEIIQKKSNTKVFLT